MLLDHWQEALILLHLSTIGPTILMGTYIMLNKKGTEPHRRLGRVYGPHVIDSAGDLIDISPIRPYLI